MNHLHEELARVHISERLSEARSQRRNQQLVAARRLARRAEEASLRMRIALARSV